MALFRCGTEDRRSIADWAFGRAQKTLFLQCLFSIGIPGVGISNLPIPKKPLYKFIGWKCDGQFISKIPTTFDKDIELIAKTKGLDSLSDELRQVAELRLEDTSLSLKDIGESLEPPISRSGVNHRLMKIAKIADEIRNSGGQNGKK